MIILFVIYIVFLSLGLPDSLLGASWLVIHSELNIAESFASIYSIIVGMSTGVASFLSGQLIRKYGTAKITFISILLTSIGLIGISFSNGIIVLGVSYIILGCGAGAIDTGLNNYVSIHYKASHMNWLHCFWGIGVTAGPIILSFFLNGNDFGYWRNGYRIIAFIQFAIAVIVGFVLKDWMKLEKEISTSNQENGADEKGFKEIIKIKGVILSIFSLGCYCGLEFLIGTWGATYIVNVLTASPNTAAKWISFYYAGIMIGRFISGFISIKFKDKTLIRIGILVSAIGMILLLIPIPQTSLIGLMIIGIGYGPIFPSILHSIPERFGKEYSVDITGYHMGGAGVVGYLIQLIFGYVASATTFKFLPFVLLSVCLILFIINEVVINMQKSSNNKKYYFRKEK